ncbi:MAG TPA: response regulator [Stellaceae bacterium]|nr:response regulator [Stellaceae bacterium]
MRTVLVVDDEFGVAEVLESILTDAGYNVVSAINGRQGLARLSKARPDVVLLDFMMPLVNGPAMLRAMAADPAYRTIPVIMMSSLDEETVRRECDRFAAFLRKPFRASAVRDAVARVLDNNRGSDDVSDLS